MDGPSPAGQQNAADLAKAQGVVPTDVDRRGAGIGVGNEEGVDVRGPGAQIRRGDSGAGGDAHVAGGVVYKRCPGGGDVGVAGVSDNVAP